MKLFEGIALEQNVFKDNLSLEEINSYIDTISQEGLVDDAIEKIKSIFASLGSMFKQYTIEGTAENDLIIQNELKKINESLAVLKSYPNPERLPALVDSKANVLIAVPNGFKGELADYMDKLLIVSTKLQNITMSEIEKYNAILANIISNENARKSHNNLHQNYTNVSNNVNKAKDIQHSYFNYSGSNHGLLKLGKLVDSFRELVSLEDKSIKLANSIKFKDIMLVNTGITKTTELLNVIISDVNSSYSTSLIKELAVYTKEIASMCEAYSIARYYNELCIVMSRNCICTVAEG